MAKNLKTFFKFRQASFNREFKSIYVECKDQFIRTFLTKYPGLNINDLEEIYDDSALAFYNNVKDNKLVELTCSLQTYINRIGENKIIDLFRKGVSLWNRCRIMRLWTFAREQTSIGWLTMTISKETERMWSSVW